MTLDAFWIHSVNVQTYAGAGAFGPTYADPVPVVCFIDDSAKLVRNAAGDEVVSATTIYAPPSVAAAFVVDSLVDVNGRTARVIAVNSLDGTALGLPSHVAVSLT